MKPAIFRKKILKLFIAATGIICWLGIILIPIQFFTGFLLGLFGIEWTKFIVFFIIFCFIVHIILTSVTENKHWFEWINQLIKTHEKGILKTFIPIAGITSYLGILFIPICYLLVFLEVLSDDWISFVFFVTIFSLIFHIGSSYQLGIKNWFVQGLPKTIFTSILHYLTVNERRMISIIMPVAGIAAYLGIILLLMPFFINFSEETQRKWLTLLLLIILLSLLAHIFSSYQLGIKNWFGQDYYEAVYIWIVFLLSPYEKRIKNIVIMITGVLGWLGIITLVILYSTGFVEELEGLGILILYITFFSWILHVGFSYQSGLNNWFGHDMSTTIKNTEPYQKKSSIKFFRYVYYRVLLAFKDYETNRSRFQIVKYLLFLIPLSLLLPISFFTVYLLNLGTVITIILMTLAYGLMAVIYMKTNTEGMEKEIIEEFASYKNNLMAFFFYGYLMVIISVYAMFFYLLTSPEFRAILEAFA